MDKHKKSLIILVFVNIMVACFVQVICSPIIIEKIDMPLFQFVVLPLALVLVNVAMALKFNLKFYQYFHLFHFLFQHPQHEHILWCF